MGEEVGREDESLIMNAANNSLERTGKELRKWERLVIFIEKFRGNY